MLYDGLYEQVISKEFKKNLCENNEIIYDAKKIDNAEAPFILSKYIAKIVEMGLSILQNKKENNISKQISLVNRIISVITEVTEDTDFNGKMIAEEAHQLMAAVSKRNNIAAINNKIEIPRPITSIATSTLFTGSHNEPSMMEELKKEICSADRIDMLVSFIKWSGLRRIIEELRNFTQRGGLLRIITTSYMGATDIKAIEELQKLPNTQIKISYDTKKTRLHAKSYIFYRNTGFTTAYIGSSNLSNAAITDGLEWNLKITAYEQPEIVNKITATFNTYWNNQDFSDYTENDRNKLEAALSTEINKKTDNISNLSYSFDIHPYDYQQEVLDKLQAERERGHYRNLVVAATGTGKTVISAFDYKYYRKCNPQSPCRILFIAHREEILRQSLKCFQGILHDANFGELFVGSNDSPKSLDNLFVSVQTLKSKSLTDVTDPDFYDLIIIDEFHHTCAPTYQKLLEYYKPKILLGLTATPERMDGKNILDYFDGRIAAEIRLPEAIDRGLLCPFQYFGVSDTISLSELKWTRGGYDRTELSKIYTGNDNRTMEILLNIRKYVEDINKIVGIGFCVSKEHAEYMAKRFSEEQIPSASLTSDSSDQTRKSIQSQLVNGEIKFIFVVDLYNEGVDIPEINTILFLRPTESLTVFLQQLGRGLRLSDNKECLTVLDFIGQANNKYSFEQKFEALRLNTNRSLKSEIEGGFNSLPNGCCIQLEKKAQEYILKNINQAIGNKNALQSRIQSFTEDSGIELTLANFLTYYCLDISAIYSTKTSFSRLMGLNFQENIENVMTKAFQRICAIDSQSWIEFLVEYLPKISKYSLEDFNECQIRMLQMTQFTIWQKSYEDCGFADLLEGFRQLEDSPVMLGEMLNILRYNYNKIDFVAKHVDLGFDCPLDVYCTYTRDQILVALDYMKPQNIREGTKYLEEKKIDVHFITLNKTEKDYSPTTMYNDYSINNVLFHWQSQNKTADTSPTGQRYINHAKTGDTELIFVRENKNNKLGTSPYIFLGIADYVSHEGSKPMNIVWRLREPIPAKYIKKTSKLLV